MKSCFRLSFLIACGLLTACQPRPVLQQSIEHRLSPIKKHTNDERDSAPSGPVPTHFKTMKVKNEPLSRYGNPSTYQVKGKTYNIMTTSSGYRTRGLASWYGTKFHQRRTSSGENYDMYALTAAHKTLPLPTYIRVKNLKNGRMAIIKVNDRGPFHSDRILDLSYGAAAKLGIFPQGTAWVEIEALNVPGAQHKAHYYIQTGAFSSSARAQAFLTRLRTFTPSPVFIERHQQNQVVMIGPFAERAMSDALKRTLLAHGVSGAFSLLK